MPCHAALTRFFAVLSINVFGRAAKIAPASTSVQPAAKKSNQVVPFHSGDDQDDSRGNVSAQHKPDVKMPENGSILSVDALSALLEQRKNMASIRSEIFLRW